MKVLVVDSEWDEPDVKVYRVNSKFDADAVVRTFASEYDVVGSLIEDETLKWVLVSTQYYEHDLKVMWTDSPFSADIKVMLCSSDFDATWVDESKKSALETKDKKKEQESKMNVDE